MRRAAIVREEIGPDRKLMMDANQAWDVDEAIDEHARAGAHSIPGGSRSRRAPTTCSATRAIARAIAPIGVATGEQCQNRVVFKQLMQASAIDFCQIDACRLGGVNEVIAVLLLAAKFGVPVCPHAGGVGPVRVRPASGDLRLTSAVSASLENRIVEYVDHLHEHFVDPVWSATAVTCRRSQPGYSVAMLPESLDEYEFPTGHAWADAAMALEEA